MKPRDSKAKNKSSNPGSRRCPTFSFSCLQAFDMSCIRVVGTHPIYKLMTKRHEPPWTEGGEKGEQQQLNGYMSVCNVKSIPENHSACTPPHWSGPWSGIPNGPGGGSMVTNIGKGEGAICPGLRCLLWLGWVSNSKLELIRLSINHIRFSLTFVSMCQVKAWLPYVLHNTSADNNVHNSRLQSWHQDALRRGVWIRIVFTRGGGSNSMVLKSSVNSPRS